MLLVGIRCRVVRLRRVVMWACIRVVFPVDEMVLAVAFLSSYLLCVVGAEVLASTKGVFT